MFRPVSSVVFLCFFLLMQGCATVQGKYNPVVAYDFSSPDMRLLLPDTLREISGLTIIDSTTVACVQDENGILFFYDTKENRVKAQYVFYADGDYEGIARVGIDMYVLRSDGILFRIADYASPGWRVDSFATGIPATNNEGLCYDKARNRLLIACKSNAGKGWVNKNRRMVFAFDLGTNKLMKEAVCDIDLKDIQAFAEKNSISLPHKGSRNRKDTRYAIKFRTSEIGIHPVTQKLYLLSAADHALFVFDGEGRIEQMEILDERLFNKAEGISFFSNGDMLITNEAQNKKPTLLRFNYMR